MLARLRCKERCMHVACSISFEGGAMEDTLHFPSRREEIFWRHNQVGLAAGDGGASERIDGAPIFRNQSPDAKLARSKRDHKNTGARRTNCEFEQGHY